MEWKSERDFEEFMSAQVERIFIFKNELENKLTRSIGLEKAARRWIELRAGQFRTQRLEGKKTSKN